MLRHIAPLPCRTLTPSYSHATILYRISDSRTFSYSKKFRNENDRIFNTSKTSSHYTGPQAFTKNFTRLRKIALSSLGLSVGLSPVIMAVEGSMPTTARIFFIATALLTSAGGTSLIHYMGSPYVTQARLVQTCSVTTQSQGKESFQNSEDSEDSGGSILELHTQTLFSRPRITRIYDPAFLTDTGRGFATMELASCVTYTPSESEGEGAAREETVAETLNESGKVLGRWIVTWSKDGQGQCRGVGSVARYFSMPKEELPQLH